ncbi:hypothetical protein BJX96DRAFT_176118 [Aspergillus floccosus]
MPSEEIHNIAVLVPQDDKMGDLLEAFGKLSRYVQLHDSETLVYYAIEHTGQNELVIVEKYANESAFKRHAQSEALNEFVKAISGILQTPPVIKPSIFSVGFEVRPQA